MVVELDGNTLTPAMVEEVANGGAVCLTTAATERMARSSSWHREHGAPDVIRSKWAWLVGGPAPTTPEEAVRAFIEGHCAGVGAPLAREEVRALLLVRANALAAGWSGVRPELVQRMLTFLERDWAPIVPHQGSVGAAGCVALAHAARVLLGLGGAVEVNGANRTAQEVTTEFGAFSATEKEALSLINASSLATALGALAVVQARRVLLAAEAACALSMEAIRADAHALDARAAAVRGHPGIEQATARLRALVANSELVTLKRQPDSFSVRCAPVVLGAARDALDHVETVVTRELNSAADNPLVFPDDGDMVQGGHFHGAPVALVMDHLKVAMAQLSGISERRIFRLTYGELSGLPSFLVPGSGLNSGLMLAQYTAASLVSEAKTLSVATSADSVPTVQHQEDHVSMGPGAARGALEVVDRAADVVAIELLCAAQALEFRIRGDATEEIEVANPGPATRRVFEAVRERVPRLVDDRFLHPDLVTLGHAVRTGVFSQPWVSDQSP